MSEFLPGMDPRFRAFTFVDRITTLDPGRRISGRFSIPRGVEEFPLSLVAEAVGQLAAWSAMAVVDFKSRPVAGLAARIDLLHEVFPGQTLELSAEFESVDGEAASYAGAALVDGVPVVRLHHCVGPMVPMEEFDDPAAVRAKFIHLCSAVAHSGGFPGLPVMPLVPETVEAGRCVRARFQVPATALLFGDHFPRRPVFPGSLLMHLNLKLAAALASEFPPPDAGGSWLLRSVTDMKLRAFIPPGECLDLEATLKRRSANAATVVVQSRGGARIVGGARVELMAEIPA